MLTNLAGRSAALMAAVLLVGLTAAPAQSREAVPTGPDRPVSVEPQLREQLAGGDTADFWVYLRDDADLGPARAMASRGAQGKFVYEQLTSAAAASQQGLRAMLDAEGVPHEPYWIANAVRVTGDRALLDRIAARAEVAQVTGDRVYELPEPLPAAEQPAASDVEWGVDRINAPQVWSEFGASGEGIVVASIDSGVQFDHPALVEQYRGNLGDGTFDHNYQWHDPSDICSSPAPCDNQGHGTHVTGTIVGDDGGDNRIGVAPDAQWIAAKGCEGATCTQSALLSSGQFVLAPTDLQGENPDPQRRPHIVNNSWGGDATTDPWYRETVQAWVAAGIFPQFSSGNTLTGLAPCGSASNPANLPESYASGAFDIDNQIADFSNRGPSAWDSELVKPDISAPGVDVRSSVPGGGYAPNSGTSMASPHVAGAIALLWSAAEPVARDIDATRDLLDMTAIDVEDLTCGGTAENNNVWGQGRLDVYRAVQEAPRGPTGRLAGTVTDASSDAPVAGASITIAGGEDRERTTAADGSYGTNLPAGEYAVTASAFGYQPQSADVTIVDGETLTRDFDLEPLELVTVSGQITDGSGHGWPMYARVDVAGTPVSTFTDPMTGEYELALPVGDTYPVVAEPQYPGYGDVEEPVAVGDADLTLDLAALVDDCEAAPGHRLQDECVPVDGGLVLGHVTDLNTGDGVNDATVVGAGGAAGSGESFATPEDPDNEDGFYWLFSSSTGTPAFTASAVDYGPVTETVPVIAGTVNPANFALPTGQLAVSSSEVAATVRLGQSAEGTFTVTNTGTGPAAMELGQLPGSFEILGGDHSGTQGQEWRAPADLAPNPDYDPDSATTMEQYQDGTAPDATPHAPGEILAAWPPDGLSLAWGVGVDDGNVWLSDANDVANYEFTADGTATGRSHPARWAGTWPADMTRLADGEMCQVNVGDDQGIYCWDTEEGIVIGSITGAFPWTAISQRGLAYRAGDDTFYIGGWNEDVLYQVRGFSHDIPGEVVQTCDFAGMGMSGLAWNPTAELLWVATNSATDDIHLVDPDGCEVLDTLGHPTPGYNGAGLHMNDEGNLWMVSQGNSGAERSAYLVESGLPTVADVPWLATSPESTVLQPGDSATVRVSMDSDAAEQRQPGTYQARLRIAHDTPYAVEPVDVQMSVTPPHTWGKVTGTVTGVACDGAEHVPFGATVRFASRDLDVTLRTDAGGGYTHWVPVRQNPVTVEATADGYQPESERALVVPRRDEVVDFAIRRTDEFGHLCEPEDAAFQQADPVLPISGPRDTETIDLPFPFRFYGQTYNEAHVCSNGFIEFAGPGSPFPIGCAFPNARIPTQARPDTAIYPYWDPELVVDEEASVRAEEKGVAPERRFVIEFRNLGYSEDPTQRIDFNIVLHENGDVLTQYRNVADNERARGGAATIGIEDHTGSDALQHSYETPTLEPGAVTSIRYQPPPPEPPAPGPEAWAARYDGPTGGDEVARAVGVSPDGLRVFVTGQSPGGEGDDYATVAYDDDTGEQLWTARYDGPAGGGDSPRGLEVSPDGSRVFVTGFGAGDGTGDDYATVAYDAATGDELWVARYDGGGGDQAYAIGMSADGSQVFVTGRSIGDGTSFDYATVAYDAASGDELWAVRYDGPISGLEQALALDVSPDGARVYVTGQSSGEGWINDYATVAYDATDGSELWVARYGGPAGGSDVSRAVAANADTVFVTGQSTGDGFSNDYATVAYDAATGEQRWVTRYDGPTGSSDLAQAVGVNADGVYVTGQSIGDGTSNDYATVAYDPATGEQRWVARYDGPAGSSDTASAIGVSADAVFVTGESQGAEAVGPDYATVAYDVDGNQLWDPRYTGPGIGSHSPRALAVSADGARVYVTGDSPGEASDRDYATVAYDTARD